MRDQAPPVPLIHWSESYHDADQFHLSGFLNTDPFLTLALPGQPVLVAVNAMELGRARKESRRGASVRDLGVLAGKEGVAGAVRRLLGKGREVRVLPQFPLALARRLEAAGVKVAVDPRGTSPARRKKSASEIAGIEQVQRHLEGAFALVHALLGASHIRRGGLECGGCALTAEALRCEIEAFLLSRNCECADTIVAPGRGSADPHWRGEGPIRPGVPIVVDIFPRDRSTRLFSDMTRTFVKGKASPEVAAMHRATCAAQDAAFASLRVGGSLAKVHEAVCRVFQKKGYGVPVEGRVPRSGFLHGTGHGVGLAIHEEPSVSFRGDLLAPGDVVTIEPGLYDRRHGGVRIEDIVAVNRRGAVRRLTDFPRDLEIP